MGNEPLRPSPTTTGIAPTDLEEYFKSIVEAFRQTHEQMDKHETASKRLLLFMVLCAIPVIPYLLHEILFLFFGPISISLRFTSIEPTSFFFLWWTLAFPTIILMYTWGFFGPSKKKTKGWLNQQQMRFAYCYGVIDEIRNYKTNHIERHLDRGIEYLRKTALLMPDIPLVSADKFYAEVKYIGDPTYRIGLVNKPKWFRLRPETELILKANSELLSKLEGRIEDKKDLLTIELVLASLAGYFYTEIPELSNGQVETKFKQAGEGSLLSYAAQIADLPPYQSAKQLAAQKKGSMKMRPVGQRLGSLFMHENVLAAFFVWYIFMFLLFSVGFYVAFRVLPSMKMDTAVVTTIVGGPISTAVVATTIPRVGKAKKE